MLQITGIGRLFVTICIVVFVVGCDKITDTTSGGGGDEIQAAAEQTTEDTDEAGSDDSSDIDSEPVQSASGEITATVDDNNNSTGSNNDTVHLDAFKDFKCTSNWKNRDGGLGLKVGSGKGTCEASFPGGSGRYRVELGAQTEREGQSPYSISINGQLAGSGKFPFSQGEVNCKCHKQPWQIHCPDVVMYLDAGTHNISTGDTIEYYGEEEYLCGKHGAYSKWREMVFTPVN